MSYSTYFLGAIRVTPCIEESLAKKLNKFLGIRHMRRNVEDLAALYPDEEARKEVTVFGDGDFGEEGAFYIPSVSDELTSGLIAQIEQLTPIEGLRSRHDLNCTPKGIPTLYSSLEIRSDSDGAHSYIAWDDGEDGEAMDDWLEILATALVKRGYHLDGKLFASGDDILDLWEIEVKDELVTAELIVPKYTYDDEASLARYVK